MANLVREHGADIRFIQAMLGHVLAAAAKMKPRNHGDPAMTAPVSVKQEVVQLLAQLPDEATLEDIQYHPYVLEKIPRGRADVAAGRSDTREKLRERLSRWLPD